MLLIQSFSVIINSITLATTTTETDANSIIVWIGVKPVLHATIGIKITLPIKCEMMIIDQIT